MEDSVTELRRDIDIIDTIFRSFKYAENSDILEIELTRFEGHHFSDFTPKKTPEKLLKRVRETLVVLKKGNGINDYSIPNVKKITLEISIRVDITDKKRYLKYFRTKVKNRIEQISKNDTDTIVFSPPLLSEIPSNNKKYNTPRKIAKLFTTKLKTENYKIAGCIEPTYYDKTLKKRRKFTKNRYLNNKKYYDKLIKNSLRYLNREAAKYIFTFVA